ncbi:polysaccharide pyruvyl transferase family protein [Virgibacillus pantothenticus]|uniref:polysaccharide pyruvyl transferase family protein n=1 Tax=Virgibacillus pantothenticus TaxID=1473 RepID=UPI003D290A06
MKNVMLYAYTHYNLGDDLFIKTICERYPNTNFLLLAPKGYCKTFSNLNNLKIINSDSLLFRGSKLIATTFNKKKLFYSYLARKCHLQIYAGGSLFIQHDYWKEEYKNVQAMSKMKIPFFILGANFGPFYEQSFLHAYYKIFFHLTDICFRDHYSYSLFKELPNVRLATDMIFQLEPICLNKANQSLIISVIKPSIRKSLQGYDEIYYNKIREITLHFLKEGYDVTLMSFCEYEQDHEAIKHILAPVSKHYINHIHTFYYKNNLEKALKLISSCTFVVATRFHAMILGWLYQKSVFPIVYSSKMTNMIKDVNFQGNYTQFHELETLEAETVYQSMSSNRIDVTEQIMKAKEQFIKLDTYLETEN